MAFYCLSGFASYHLGKIMIKNMIASLSLQENIENNENDINNEDEDEDEDKEIEIKIKIKIKIKTNIIPEKNYISLLQEYAQKKEMNFPEYIFRQIEEQLFECNCKFNGIEKKHISNNKKHAKLCASQKIYEELKDTKLN
jgi:hypothetical protein